MARTIPSAFNTGAAAAYGRLHILVKVTDQPTSLYLTTAADGLSYDSLTWDGDLHEFKFAVGPDLDWRGGLASDGSAAISVIQAHASVAGTATNNTFDKLKAIYDYITPVTGLYEASLLNEASGDVRISMVWDDGTPTAAESIEVFRGFSENLSQANSGPLTIRLDPERQRWLKRTFLRKIGYEDTDRNYDYGHANPRPLYEPSDGAFAPLMYGYVQYAKGVPVHTDPTFDDNTKSGLVLCFSDAAHSTFCPFGSANDPELFVTYGETSAMIPVMRLDPSGSTQYEWGSSTDPEYIGGTSGGIQGGAYVRFLDNTFAGDGKFVFRGSAFMAQSTAAESADGAEATYSAAMTLDAVVGDYYHEWRMVDVNLPGSVYCIDAQIKIYESFDSDEYFAAKIRVGSTNHGPDSSERPAPLYFYDNIWSYLYSDSGGAEQTITSSLDTERWNADATNWPNPIGLNDLTFRIYENGGTARMWAYGAKQQVWTTNYYEQFVEQVYGRVYGIRGSTTYRVYSTDYVYNPAEVFYHFVEEVLGQTGKVDTSSITTAGSAMNTDGVRLDFQLLDGDMTAEELLDKLALQAMCYIAPTSGGKERIIYRPSYHASALDSGYDPISASDILKGTMRSEYTSRDDVRAGAIVNYGWNEALGKFEGRKIMVPTGHRLDTNFTNATLQGWVDAIEGDFEAIEVDADLIQDETTAELLCKWLVQLHGRRRQILEFELPLEFAWIEAGDVIGVDHPMVRVYASGDQCELTLAAYPSSWPMEFKCATATTVNPPVPSGADIVPIVHRGDILFIESGTYAGDHYHCYPANSGADVYISHGPRSLADTYGNWRICPSFDVLSAKVAHSRTEGPRIQVRCIERPVLRAMSDSITD